MHSSFTATLYTFDRVKAIVPEVHHSPSSIMAHYQDYGVTAPHGPDAIDAHDPNYQMTENEKQIFDYLIKPDDSYDTHGVYWADMPLMKRIKFVTTYDAGEAARELRSIWQMAKRDPLEPVMYYIRNMVIPGAGLGLEGYSYTSLALSEDFPTNSVSATSSSPLAT